MAFLLDKVVPWGRNREEYVKMFSLTEEDLHKNIASFGDGPGSFNYQQSVNGQWVTSFDLIYQFTKEQIESQIDKTKETVMEQMRQNKDNYLWTDFKDLSDLEQCRMSAMRVFLDDFDKGKREGRYVYHNLPNKTEYADDSFDLGLSSHFLLMYTNLGYEFHIQAIDEMLRICKEIRITPVVDLDGKPTELTVQIVNHYNKLYDVQIITTDYLFLKNSNRMLRIKKIIQGAGVKNDFVQCNFIQ
jgi:hypothetical protein